MNPEPEHKPALDRTTLLPIILGVFSLFGILLVFMIGRFNANRPVAPAEDTPTPFKYQLIGTEPGISTSEPPTEIASEPPVYDLTTGPIPDTDSTPTKITNLGLVVTAQQGGSSGSSSNNNNNNNNGGGTSPTKTKTKTSSSAIQTTAAGSGTDPIIILNPGTKTATSSFGIIVRTSTPSRTPRPTITVTPSRTRFATATSDSLVTATPSRTSTTAVGGPTQVPLVPSSVEYDDAHPLIAYSGWNPVSDLTAYQGTLHVSNTVGSTVTFRFTGQQIRLKFQSGGSFGFIRINIGGLNFDLDESNGTNEWVSVLLAHGTYTVTITHTSGGSVNLDSIFIPDLNTPTPTSTPTVTPTSQ